MVSPEPIGEERALSPGWLKASMDGEAKGLGYRERSDLARPAPYWSAQRTSNFVKDSAESKGLQSY